MCRACHRVRGRRVRGRRVRSHRARQHLLGCSQSGTGRSWSLLVGSCSSEPRHRSRPWGGGCPRSSRPCGSPPQAGSLCSLCSVCGHGGNRPCTRPWGDGHSGRRLQGWIKRAAASQPGKKERTSLASGRYLGARGAVGAVLALLADHACAGLASGEMQCWPSAVDPTCVHSWQLWLPQLY